MRTQSRFFRLFSGSHSRVFPSDLYERCNAAFVRWQQRRGEHLLLSRLSEHELKDAGITRAQQSLELSDAADAEARR